MYLTDTSHVGLYREIPQKNPPTPSNPIQTITQKSSCLKTLYFRFTF